MASKWPTVRLGDHVDSSLGKMLDANKNKGALAPYLGNSNVRWGQFDLANLAQMKFEPHEAERYGIRDGDLIVCEGGEPGRCAIWREELPDMKIQKALHRVRPKDGLNNYYLFYWLTLAGLTGHLEPYFTGTTIKHLTGKALAELQIPLPPLEEQRAIAETLGALDDRIDNLRQTNATLEAIAAALFKSWFVDFDGVAPEDMQESELGLIPKGWQVVTIGDVINRLSAGKRYEQKAIATTGNVPVLDQGKSGIAGYHNEEPGITASPDNPVITFSNHTCNMRIISFPFSAIQNVLPFIGKDIPTPWLYYATTGKQALTEYKGHWPDFIRNKILAPNICKCNEYSNAILPILKRKWQNEINIETLAILRDTLLPKLIHGELRTPKLQRNSIETPT